MSRLRSRPPDGCRVDRSDEIDQNGRLASRTIASADLRWARFERILEYAEWVGRKDPHAGITRKSEGVYLLLYQCTTMRLDTFAVMAFYRGCIIGIPISLILWALILFAYVNMAGFD